MFDLIMRLARVPFGYCPNLGFVFPFGKSPFAHGLGAYFWPLGSASITRRIAPAKGGTLVYRSSDVSTKRAGFHMLGLGPVTNTLVGTTDSSPSAQRM